MASARQLRVVALAVASIGVAMAVLLAQAFGQRPIEQLPAPALVVVGGCTVGLAAAYAAVAAALVQEYSAAHTPGSRSVNRA